MRVGQNCHIYSDLFTAESFLVEIGDNVTVSNGVQFITHDNSICKVLPEFTDIFGAIKIGSNSFVGAKTVIMRGVTIPANTIIGAGSVVTRSFTEERTIIAGNPARVVGNWDTYAKKYANIAVNVSAVQGEAKEALILQSAERLQNK
jgi:acetyltransferase-like isoleucine patch superfamily enzyme